MNLFAVIGTAFLLVAGLIHVFIFVLESVSWSKPATWKRFGIRSQEDADVVRPMAFNQGWYNLFLAVGTIGGSVAAWTGFPLEGLPIALFAGASMVAAALVLVISNPRLARAAAMQGIAPLLGVIFVVLGLSGLTI
jgi:putative membrane protein